jgi:cobalt/nickel transport system permease protein
MGGLGSHALERSGLAGDLASPVHRLDPRAKVAGLLVLVLVAVSTPLRAWPAFVACAAVLLLVALTARVHAGTIARRASVVLPLVLFVAAFVPFMRPGGAEHQLGPLTVSEAGLATFALVALKAMISTVGAVLLSATTSFPDVLRGLDGLRAPRMLTLIAAFMYRYLFVIVDELRRVRAALAARAYHPRRVTQAGPLGRVAAALFVRTYARGERVYLAMLARGYSGTMPALERPQVRRVELVAVGATLATLVAVRVAAELFA